MRSWRASRPSCSRRLFTLEAATSLTLMPSGRICVSVVLSTCSVIDGLPNFDNACVHLNGRTPAAIPKTRRRDSWGRGARDTSREGREAARRVGEAGLLADQVAHGVGGLHAEGA